MKVILNKDISPLGEEGDVKEVARGYARNFLFPRRFALPYTERSIKIFEARKDEIAERKKLKRDDAAGIKERLEALELAVAMPAGANGKLYGAVTSQTIMDELAKEGFTIERKRIEIPGNSIKSTGKYKFTVKLYGNTTAEMSISITAQEIHTQKAPPKEKKRRSTEGRASDTEAATSPAPDAEAIIQQEADSPAPEGGEPAAAE
ncbi:MAG: 50S ribosomal protein L9 [Spirochaetaceae bacterium]|nr:50S ribosomal protein L9 [Spirochaetaceae bacterium]